MTSAALVATEAAHGVEGARREEERTRRVLLGRGEVTQSEARPPAVGDRGKARADCGAKRSSRDVSTSSRGPPRKVGEGANASLGLSWASRAVTSPSRGTTGAALASIEPARLVAVAHLLVPSGAGLGPTAPLRVRTALVFTPRCPLPLDRDGVLSASASRRTWSASRNTSTDSRRTSTDALALCGAALGRPDSADDGRHEALAPSEPPLLEAGEAPRMPRYALEVPRAALLATRAALPVPREALVGPRAALERRSVSQITESVPRHAVECASRETEVGQTRRRERVAPAARVRQAVGARPRIRPLALDCPARPTAPVP